MKSNEWDRRGWKTEKLPSGEIIRTKEYQRALLVFENTPEVCLVNRQDLAEILQVPVEDLLCNLEITIKCKRHRRHGFLFKSVLEHLIPCRRE